MAQTSSKRASISNAKFTQWFFEYRNGNVLEVYSPAHSNSTFLHARAHKLLNRLSDRRLVRYVVHLLNENVGLLKLLIDEGFRNIRASSQYETQLIEEIELYSAIAGYGKNIFATCVFVVLFLNFF